MLKAATGCLALLCKAQGGTVYQHAGDQHHYVVTTESGHVVIYQRTVTDDKVAYTPIFDENDFPPTA